MSATGLKSGDHTQNKRDTGQESSENYDIACNKYFTVVWYEYVVHNSLEIWAKCEELRIITEIKWLRTEYFQNRSYGNYSFIDLIGEKSNICGIKKEGKKEGRTRELCSRTQTHLHLTIVLCAVLWPVFLPSSSSCPRFYFPLHNTTAQPLTGTHVQWRRLAGRETNTMVVLAGLHIHKALAPIHFCIYGWHNECAITYVLCSNATEFRRGAAATLVCIAHDFLEHGAVSFSTYWLKAGMSFVILRVQGQTVERLPHSQDEASTCLRNVVKSVRMHYATSRKIVFFIVTAERPSNLAY
jgi:hypothetical protein